MAWKRVIEMSVGAGGTGLLISGLNVSFEIERTVELSNNSAQFTVYNAKKETRNNVLSNGNNIIFRAGYDDEKNIGTIFMGTISKSVSSKQGVDWVTEITAQDISNNREALEYTTVKYSYKSNTPLATVINDIASTLGIAIAGVENVTRILNNGFVYSGNFSNLLHRINGMISNDGLRLYFDSSEMIIYRKGLQNSRFGIVRLSKNSGLIGEVAKINNENEQDKKDRVGFQCLLNPKIKPNTVINLVSEKINGSYIVEKVTFSGDNFGGDFLCDVEAVA